MPESALPFEVRDLIARHLATMEHVDVLLLLARAPEHALSIGAIAERLRIPEGALPARAMADLVESGLVAREKGGPGGTDEVCFRYAPKTAAQRAAVEALAVAYNERPVTLVKAIYSRPTNAVQSFADAFRLRKEES